MLKRRRTDDEHKHIAIAFANALSGLNGMDLLMNPAPKDCPFHAEVRKAREALERLRTRLDDIYLRDRPGADAKESPYYGGTK